MNTDFEYYYNNVPEKGLCRNNLIYTSLISKDKKTFCQWYHNDTDYHRGMNQVVDPALMDEKWQREVKFLSLMRDNFPDHVPNILDIDLTNKKIYLEIDGPDLWELAGCQGKDYSNVLSDWDTQMLEIISAHKKLGIYKISMHPSSYFIVNGKLKSINYFFCYDNNDEKISLKSVLSHISEDRQKDLFPKMQSLGLSIDQPIEHKFMQTVAFESFKTNFLDDVMEQAKKIYV
jgi:tRNA A-37 threonylcarbamoyl transferase component Bud32